MENLGVAVEGGSSIQQRERLAHRHRETEKEELEMVFLLGVRRGYGTVAIRKLEVAVQPGLKRLLVRQRLRKVGEEHRKELGPRYLLQVSFSLVVG